jgi:predicted LPLAT superfamily acyltransferase
MAAYRRFKPRPVRPVEDPRPAPLPGVVVDAVLRFHDEEHDQGGGRTLLRLSRRRLGDAEVSRALGDLAPRAARVSILWNEHEAQIIRVLEAA